MKIKLSFNKKITLTFIVIIIISLILYTSLLAMLFKINFRNERFIHDLRKNTGLNENTIKNIEEFNKNWPKERMLPPILPPLIILRSPVMVRITIALSGGVLIIILVAASGGFLFLRRTLHQINYITKNVKEIDEKKLHIRLNIKGKDAIAKMSQTFDNMLNKLEASFDNQKRFIENASHELNTPLTIIKTNIDVLKINKNTTKKDYEEVINLIDNEVKKLSEISNKLLDISDNKNDSGDESKS